MRSTAEEYFASLKTILGGCTLKDVVLCQRREPDGVKIGVTLNQGMTLRGLALSVVLASLMPLGSLAQVQRPDAAKTPEASKTEAPKVSANSTDALAGT